MNEDIKNLLREMIEAEDEYHDWVRRREDLLVAVHNLGEQIYWDMDKECYGYTDRSGKTTDIKREELTHKKRDLLDI